MKKNILMILIGLSLSTASWAATETLEQRVEELEADASLNIFKFNALFTDRMDVVGATPSSGTTVNTTANRIKFGLGMSAAASQNLTGYARVVMSKYTNDTYRQGQDPTTSISRDLSIGDAYASPALYVDNAYFDYNLTSMPLTFSAGRLPTMFGPPTQLWNARDRMGTYPRLAYDSTLDGVAFTYKLNSVLPENNSLALRFIYTPFSQHNWNSPTSQPTLNGGLVQEQSVAPAVTGMLDYSLGRTSFFDSLNFIVQYISLTNFVLGDGSGTFNNQTINFTSNLKIGLQFLTSYIELVNLLHSDFTLSYSHLISSVKSDGIASVAGFPIGGYGTSVASGSIIGNIELLDLRYRTPFTSLRRPYVGGEYQMGSSDAVYYDGSMEDVTGFYSNRGSGVHLYILQPISDNFSLRLGYINQSQLQAPVSFGPTKDSKINFTSYYLNMRVDI